MHKAIVILATALILSCTAKDEAVKVYSGTDKSKVILTIEDETFHLNRKEEFIPAMTIRNGILTDITGAHAQSLGVKVADQSLLWSDGTRHRNDTIITRRGNEFFVPGQRAPMVKYTGGNIVMLNRTAANVSGKASDEEILGLIYLLFFSPVPLE